MSWPRFMCVVCCVLCVNVSKVAGDEDVMAEVHVCCVFCLACCVFT